MNYGVDQPSNYYANYGHHQESDQFGYGYNQENRFHNMVTDAFHETTAVFAENIIEEPNIDAQRFYDMLDAANQPIYEGCREGQSKLYLASRMMTMKADNNLSENCMDSWAELFKEYLPPDNISAESYYEIQKLVSSLGLPSEMIDVCIDYCMIFCRDDKNLQECRFCGKPRYQPPGGRTRVPYKRMWYLPITDRMKRLYQSERNAANMRWYAEQSTTNGEITHPSDAKAWKHFQTVYSDFANECRNLYLGLCTNGFSPFGMSGRQYSLWPVILTPYNLPPDMCMQNEFLFLSILVPGPKHPKRALDVFLQPLIHELKNFWFGQDVEIAATIRSIFERDFKEPHANWTQTPSKIVERYWLDPKTEAKSINSRNARYHDPDGTGIHIHRSGQTSFKARARKHSEKTGELTPYFLKVLEETHRNPDGTFIDGKLESIYNEVSSRIQEMVSELCAEDNMESCASGGLSIYTKNKIYTKVARRKKNRIYGVGSLQQEAASAHTGPPPPPTEDPVILA
ncbi:Transposon En/Spm-like [Arabidopsis suecica]|uniref:Transposon En/Spm-like n=1 Tax=Arabidopsis suecica TaxID=45249 RepID=A0A8T2AG12_ARASU|nr:Transposon En/Spm-like [Arabidopsis suecica]